jgi:hypothetical protein
MRPTIAVIVERHEGGDYGECQACGQAFPCDANTLADELASVEAKSRDINAETERQRDAALTVVERTRQYVEDNLRVWAGDTDVVSVAVVDIYQKVLNVIDTGHPLSALHDEQEPT